MKGKLIMAARGLDGKVWRKGTTVYKYEGPRRSGRPSKYRVLVTRKRGDNSCFEVEAEYVAWE